MVSKLNLAFVLCCLATLGACAQYESFKVYDIVPKDQSQVDFLYELSQSSDEYDFWQLSRLVGEPVRVMVPPKLQKEFESALKSHDLPFDVTVKDVSRMIKNEDFENSVARSSGPGIGFQRYYRFNEISGYLDMLAMQYPQRVKVEVVGRTSEGRAMKTITISNGIRNPNKKAIFVDAGIHAREWIAPAGALYVIQQLVENFNANKNLLENFDWIILPVVNPDGYEYSHTRDRMWRKTRNPNTHCNGTDANRNFDIHWAKVGTSPEPCAETYHGPNAFSEPETKIVRDIMVSFKGRCKFYLTLHSFGRYLLYPWGWTSALPPTWRDIEDVSQAGAKAMLQATGARYKVGSSTNVLYPAAGGSDDYAHGVVRIPIAITMELPAGSGSSGFDARPSEINSMVKETWVGIKAMALEVNRKFA